MADTTNIADLVMRRADCGHTTEPETPYGRWPKHCGLDMRLTNLTDRDGNTLTEDHQ